MVTAKLLNYTFVPSSESSMQIAPPKGDDDVVVPCLKEKGRACAGLHAIIRFQYWTLGKFFPSRAQYSTFYCRSVIARCRFYARCAPLEPFHKTAPFILYDLYLAENCTASQAISTVFRWGGADFWSPNDQREREPIQGKRGRTAVLYGAVRE